MLSHQALTSNPRPTDLSQNASFRPPHFSCGLSVCVFEAMQMKQTVNNVEPQLPVERVSKSPGVTQCGIRANENFAVLERDYVSRARFVHEAAMERCHAPVRYNQDRNLG